MKGTGSFAETKQDKNLAGDTNRCKVYGIRYTVRVLGLRLFRIP
jgi:hypothetical protein